MASIKDQYNNYLSDHPADADNTENKDLVRAFFDNENYFSSLDLNGKNRVWGIITALLKELDYISNDSYNKLINKYEENIKETKCFHDLVVKYGIPAAHSNEENKLIVSKLNCKDTTTWLENILNEEEIEADNTITDVFENLMMVIEEENRKSDEEGNKKSLIEVEVFKEEDIINLGSDYFGEEEEELEEEEEEELEEEEEFEEEEEIEEEEEPKEEEPKPKEEEPKPKEEDPDDGG